MFFIKFTILNIKTIPNNVKKGKAAKGPQIHPTTSIFTKNAKIPNTSVNKQKHNLLQAGTQSFKIKPKYITTTIPISRLIR